jgi:hypothetical protein
MSNEYKLKNFQDIVDKVPTDRIRDCMMELAELLFQTKAAMELTVNVARHLAEKEGKELPPLPEGVSGMLRLPEEVTWMDDGRGEVTAVLSDKQGLQFAEITRDMKSGELSMRLPKSE